MLLLRPGCTRPSPGGRGCKNTQVLAPPPVNYTRVSGGGAGQWSLRAAGEAKWAIWESGDLDPQLWSLVTTARSWTNQLLLLPHFLICQLGVLNQKISKADSPSLTLECHRVFPGQSGLVGCWGSVLLFAWQVGEKRCLLPSLFCSPRAPSSTLPFPLGLRFSGSSPGRQAPCWCHPAELKRILESLRLGLFLRH